MDISAAVAAVLAFGLASTAVLSLGAVIGGAGDVPAPSPRASAAEQPRRTFGTLVVGAHSARRIGS